MNYEKLVKKIYPNACIVRNSFLSAVVKQYKYKNPESYIGNDLIYFILFLDDNFIDDVKLWKKSWEIINRNMLYKLKS